MNKAVFLDRDGVINEYPGDADHCIGLLPKAECRHILDLDGGCVLPDCAQRVTAS